MYQQRTIYKRAVSNCYENQCFSLLARISLYWFKLFIILMLIHVTEGSSGIQPPGDFLVTNDKIAAYINKKIITWTELLKKVSGTQNGF